MENLETLLDKDDILSLIHSFELVRGGLKFDILIRECLSESEKGEFVAIPSILITQSKYTGHGNSTEEALEDCLKKIKGLSFGRIFPKERNAPKNS